MKLAILDNHGAPKGELEIGFEIIQNGRGTQAVHDSVVAYRAGLRSGTACTKTVGDVNGSNKKPWRQKGTGRARAGSYASPLWRGGGVVFGPKPRDFSKKVNKKTRSLALRKALSERIKAGDVVIVDEIKLSNHKTKTFLALLKALKISAKSILVIASAEKNLLLAARNVPNVTTSTGESLNTYDTLLCDKLIITKLAFEKIALRLSED